MSSLHVSVRPSAVKLLLEQIEGLADTVFIQVQYQKKNTVLMNLT